MPELNTHWTERDAESFLYSIATDFVRHLEDGLEAKGMNHAAFAKELDVSPGRVSQLLNNPGNLTLKLIIKSARVIGEKVAIVPYGDGDPKNVRGPIASEVFTTCWHRSGRPADFFALSNEWESLVRDPETDITLTYEKRPAGEIQDFAGTFVSRKRF